MTAVVHPSAATPFPPPARQLIENDPWDQYAELRATTPVLWAGDRRCYIALRYHDVRAALASSEFSVEHPFRASRRMFRRTMLDTDGDLHDRVRDVLLEPLRPTRMPQYAEAVVRPAVHEVLAGVAGFDRFDVIADLADRVPFRVIGAMFGIGPEEADAAAVSVRPLAAQIDHGLVPSADVAAGRARLEAIVDLMLSRSDLPEHATIGRALSDAVHDGALSRVEAADTAVLLFVAGTATTASAIGNTVACILERVPWSALRARDVEVGDVVREALRFDPPLRFTPRFVREETRLGGVTLAAGATVQLCVSSANRDPAAYAAPDEWHVGRRYEPPSLSFGRGLHSCVGAFLGQLEIAILVSELAARYDSMEATYPPMPVPGWSFRRRASLPVRVSVA